MKAEIKDGYSLSRVVGSNDGATSTPNITLLAHISFKSQIAVFQFESFLPTVRH